MNINGNKVVFASGKERHANCGILGLSPSLTVRGGNDDDFWHPDEDEWLDERDVLTAADLAELADFMIEQWTRLKTIHAASDSVGEAMCSIQTTGGKAR